MGLSILFHLLLRLSFHRGLQCQKNYRVEIVIVLALFIYFPVYFHPKRLVKVCHSDQGATT